MFYSNYVKLCSKINKSPSAVGEELGFTRASVTGWGNGATPRKSSLIKIADYFGVTATELMAGVGEQEYPPPKQAGDTLSSHLSHHVIIHSRVGYFQRIHQLVHYGPRLFRRAG